MLPYAYYEKLLAEYKTLNLLQKVLLWLLVFMTVVIVGVVIPLSKSDNVDKYTGGERALAVSAMETINHKELGSPFYFLKATVEEISVRCVKSGSDGRVYDTTPGCESGCYVRVVGWTLFGIQSYDEIYSAGTNLGGVGDCSKK